MKLHGLKRQESREQNPWQQAKRVRLYSSLPQAWKGNRWQLNAHNRGSLISASMVLDKTRRRQEQVDHKGEQSKNKWIQHRSLPCNAHHRAQKTNICVKFSSFFFFFFLLNANNKIRIIPRHSPVPIDNSGRCCCTDGHDTCCCIGSTSFGGGEATDGGGGGGGGGGTANKEGVVCSWSRESNCNVPDVRVTWKPQNKWK